MSGKSPSAESIILLMGWASLAVAALAAGVIVWHASQQYRMLGLPVATGTVIRCEPRLTHTPWMNHGIGSPSFSPAWTIDASYTYTVQGTSYTSTTFSQRNVRKVVKSAHPDGPPPASIGELCRRFSPGSTVQVHYHPNEPGKSFLYFNSPWNDWVVGLFPLIAALVGWFFLFAARLARK